MGRLTGPASVSLAPLASPNSNGGSFPRPSDPDDSREFWEAYSDRGSRRRLPTAALSLFLAFAIGIGMAGGLIVAYPKLHLPIGPNGPGSTSIGGNGTNNGTVPGGGGPPGNGSVNTTNNTISNGTGNSNGTGTNGSGNSTGNSTGGNSTGGSSGGGSSGNSTGNSTGGSGGNNTGNSTGGTGSGNGSKTSGPPPPPPHGPPGLGATILADLNAVLPLAELGGLFALLIGFALAVLFESMFPARSPRRPGQRWTLPKLPRRTRRPQPVDPRRAIAEALARLDWELVARLLAVPGAASDAEIRTRIVQLYSQLLQSVTPGLGNLSSRTAREIEDLGVSRLGLRRETSRELTRLFEEARYSTHPLGRSSLETARAALNRMLDDLRSFSGAW